MTRRPLERDLKIFSGTGPLSTSTVFNCNAKSCIVYIFSTVILASHSLLQFVAFWCRSAFIVASDWFVLPI